MPERAYGRPRPSRAAGRASRERAARAPGSRWQPAPVPAAIAPVAALCAVLLVAAVPVRGAWAQAPGAAAAAGTDRAPSTELASLLADARAALAEGRADDAYARLEAAAPRHAGDVGFDYLLGLAALDSGRPGAAVIALERVLATDPAHLPARAEIGRAHLALRELDAARRELETVARSPLPPAVRDTVERYLDTVVRLGERQPAWIVQLEANAGHDDNVNFGSSFGEWVLADGRALVPLPSSRPRESAFAAVAAAVTRVAPIGGRLDGTVGLQFAQRVNASQHNMDTGLVEASAGLSTATAPHRLSMSLQYQHLRLDDTAFRDAAGAIVQWQWDAGPRTQLGAYAQAFDLRFPDERVRDARRRTGGLTIAHGLGGPIAPTLAAVLHAGDERTREDLPQLSFGFAGLRTALVASFAPGWRATAGWSYERRRFDGPEPLFGTVRVDRQHDLRIGVERDLDRSLTVAPVLAWTHNASTLAPNDFRRTQAFVHVRYRF